MAALSVWLCVCVWKRLRGRVTFATSRYRWHTAQIRFVDKNLNQNDWGTHQTCFRYVEAHPNVCVYYSDVCCGFVFRARAAISNIPNALQPAPLHAWYNTRILAFLIVLRVITYSKTCANKCVKNHHFPLFKIMRFLFSAHFLYPRLTLNAISHWFPQQKQQQHEKKCVQRRI